MAVVRQPEYEPAPKQPSRRGHLKVVPPTIEEAEAANAGAPRKRGFVESLYRNWLARAVLTGGMILGAYELVPPVRETIDNTKTSIGNYWNTLLEENLGLNPESFDTTKDYQYVTARNSKALSAKEIQKSEIALKAPDKTTVTSVTEPNSNIVSYVSQEPATEFILPFEIKPDSKISVFRSSTRLGLSGTPGIKDKLEISGLEKNTIIYAPVSGRYSFAQTRSRTGVSTFASLVFRDSEGNYRNLVFQFGESKSLIPEADQPESKFDWVKDGIDVKPGQPLFQLDGGQLTINIAPGYLDPNGKHVFKDGKPFSVYTPITIGNDNSKALYINQE